MELKLAHHYLAMAEGTPWKQAMCNTAQDSVFHAEGDVWTHTEMVCHAMEPLIVHLPDSTKTMLMLSALLHDVAKPETTIVENGRIRSPRHAKVGMHRARSIMDGWGVPFVMREEACRLIRRHTQPPHAFDSNMNINLDSVALSWQCDLMHLYHLVRADLTGRLSICQPDSLINLELWREYIQERELYGNPFEFGNDESRVKWFLDGYREDRDPLTFLRYQEFRCNVTFMVGVPGVGKDTWISHNCKDIPMVSMDAIREEEGLSNFDNNVPVIAKEQVRQHLRDRQDFVFNATNCVRDNRSKWLRLMYDYNAKVKIVYVEKPLEQVLRQNKGRSRVVPEQAIIDLYARRDVPDFTEAHDLEYVL